MSASLLYHALGVRGYRYVKTEYVGGEVIFTIEQPRESYRCPACGSADVIGRGQNARRFRTVPIGRKPAYLALAIPRVECRKCGAVRQVKIGFADPRVTYTKAFHRYALELSQYMTIQDVADHLGISWDEGGTLTIEASDVGSSYGILPDLIIADELSHWQGDGSLFHSLLSSAAKRSNCLLVIISNAGFADSWQWAVREAARTDEDWIFSRLEGPKASWLTEDRLAEQRRMLPGIA